MLVLNHLQTVFERAQPVIADPHDLRVFGGDDARLGKSIQAGAGAAQAQCGVAAAMDELVGLGEEFDLADAAAPALEIIAGADGLTCGIVIADAGG